MKKINNFRYLLLNILLVSSLTFLVGCTSTSQGPSNQVKENIKQEEQENIGTTSKEEKSEKTDKTTNKPQQIINVVKEVADYEVTVLKNKKNATKETSPPYEVIVNTGTNDIKSCWQAKYFNYKIMKELYTNEKTKNIISRVQFTAWGYLQSSVGSTDGKNLNWDDFQQTLFWDELKKYKDDKSKKLKNRTFGESINNNC